MQSERPRLTKAAIYATAGVPEYWIVDLRDECVDIRREPVAELRRYQGVSVAHRGEEIALVALPGVGVQVSDLLPRPRTA